MQSIQNTSLTGDARRRRLQTKARRHEAHACSQQLPRLLTHWKATGAEIGDDLRSIGRHVRTFLSPDFHDLCPLPEIPQPPRGPIIGIVLNGGAFIPADPRITQTVKRGNLIRVKPLRGGFQCFIHFADGSRTNSNIGFAVFPSVTSALDWADIIIAKSERRAA